MSKDKLKRTVATAPGEPAKHVELSKKEEKKLTKHWEQRAKRSAKQKAVVKRQEAYPPVEEQLDYIYHNGIAKWSRMIAKVKGDNPIPGKEDV